jgi:pimeloyl-ACP methyl ester carboxylesterase
MTLPEVRHETLPGDGVALHAVTAGDPAGPPVLLLHGFPEFWYGWRKQIGPLAAAGFRVVAPDQRGYNRSDKPPRVADYAVDRLAADAAVVIAALGAEPARVVGHDWGGAVAWWLALRRPERVERLAVLNCPHPAVLRRALRTNPRQMLRSWYMLALQLPWLPEWLARRGDWAPLVRALRTSSRPGTFTPEDFEHYRAAWSQPGAYTAMVNWYRAMMRAGPPLPADIRVRVPTLLIWGARDKFLGRELAPPSIELCEDGRLEVIEEATHWVQHEEPDRVNRLLIEFLKG